MIEVPTSACPPCPISSEQQLFTVPPVVDCYCPEPEDPAPLAEPFEVMTLCPCPVVEPFVLGVTPPPNTFIETGVCYQDFIRDITSTKLCVTGPKCR